MTDPVQSPIAAAPRAERNQSMECCKLIASFFVVFIHTQFPGTFAGVVTCIARFAVPTFFVISGYFSFRTGCGKLVKRMKHILLLYGAAILVRLLWLCIATEYAGGSTIAMLRDQIPDAEELAVWLFLCECPFGGHLWYLTAILQCYGVLWAYVGFFDKGKTDYRPLYVVSVCLFAMYLGASVFANAVGIHISNYFYRNGLFLGIPMFSLGIFLHEYWERICAQYALNDKKLVGLVLVGMALSLIEWRGIAANDAHIGTVLSVMALMLLMLRHPRIPTRTKAGEKLLSKCGYLSTAVYILHIVVIDVYLAFFQRQLALVLGNKELYLQPLMVMILTLAAALLWEQCWKLCCRFRKKER